jgi:hypothetical protein
MYDVRHDLGDPRALECQRPSLMMTAWGEDPEPDLDLVEP